MCRSGFIAYRTSIPAAEVRANALLDVGHPVHDAATVSTQSHQVMRSFNLVGVIYLSVLRSAWDCSCLGMSGEGRKQFLFFADQNRCCSMAARLGG